MVHRRVALITGVVLLTFFSLYTVSGDSSLGSSIVAPGAAPGEAPAGDVTADVSGRTADAAAVSLAAAQACEDTRSLALAAAERSAAAMQRRYAESQTGPVRVRYPASLASAPAQQPATPAQTAARSVKRSVRVPILMYHHVADVAPGADAVRRDLSVSPAAFSQQMDYLVSHGYQTISLLDLVEHLDNGRDLPAKPIILTFDDGYDDNYAYAYPILRLRKLTGTFFIITDFVGRPEHMTWPQIVAMSRDGLSIEAHGRTHLDLSMLGPGDTTWQVAGSKAALEEKLGLPVRFYCYPSGHYTAQTVSILSNNGFLAAVSTANGATQRANGLFELARIRMRGSDTLDSFIYKVTSIP